MLGKAIMMGRCRKPVRRYVEYVPTPEEQAEAKRRAEIADRRNPRIYAIILAMYVIVLTVHIRVNWSQINPPPVNTHESR
jgi:hypothetical protein